MKQKWALILGGSSGLGLATAHKLSLHGFNLIILHRDRRSSMEAIDMEFKRIQQRGVNLHSFNADATNPKKTKQLIQSILTVLGDQKIMLLVHSIAKGNLKPLLAENGESLNQQDMELTLKAMGISLYTWVMQLFENKLFTSDSRIIAFTSEGNNKVIPNYAAVAAAKATLESLVRSIAVEFAPLGIKANCIQAGVVDTPSLRRIPASDQLKALAIKRNPNKRLTTPEDVANVAYLLSRPEAKWITGTVIKVDGGESLC